MLKIKKLANGLEVMSAPMPGTKAVTVLAMAATGSRFENRAESGLSHFLEHMVFKGTVRRPTTLSLSSELDRAGGEFNAFTGKEYTGFYVKIQAGEIELALDVLSDMLTRPLFKKEEIEREKGVVLEELNMYLDNPLYYLEDLFEQCLYGDTPAGRDTLGDKTTIASFSRGQLLKYLAGQYGAARLILCLAGKIPPAAPALAAKYFGAVRRAAFKDKAKTDDAQTRPALKIHFKKTDQAHLSLGVRSFPYGHEDEAAVKLAAVILGGSMSSRLFIELRERRGLAYYVRTHDEAYTDTGYLTTQAGVPINRLNEAVKIILNEYKKLEERAVGAEELKRAKTSLIGRSSLRLESSETVANWYGRQMILNKEKKRAVKILTPEEYFARLKKITAADVKRVADKIFTTRKLNLAVIGPYKDENQLEKLLTLS